MEELAIKIEHVTKQYRLGAIGGGTLKGDLQSWMARKRGQEDPNSKIGSKQPTKIGERFLALDDINFEVKKGEAVGIIGHNGAGKSTLLKLLSRVTAPTSGKISIDGRIASMLEVGTGFHPELTGRENVYMNGAILGMTRAEIDKKFDEIVEFSEVAKFIDTPVKRYSSGMYVKLAFSVAAHLDSEIMIMDEVLAVGDMQFQKKCLTKMRSAAKEEGRTVLYVSHNMNTIRQLCDRCIVMDHGHIIFNGDVEEAIALYLSDNEEAQNVDTDLKSRRRPENAIGSVFMNRIQFVGLEDCVITRGDQLRIKLDWKSNKKLSDVRFRMIIRYFNDTPVGLVQSSSIGNVEDGEEVSTLFEFDTSMLAEGKYFFSIAMFQTDGIGGSIILDHVTRACSIDVVSNLSQDSSLNWEHRWWGSVQFPDLRIVT